MQRSQATFNLNLIKFKMTVVYPGLTDPQRGAPQNEKKHQVSGRSNVNPVESFLFGLETSLRLSPRSTAEDVLARQNASRRVVFRHVNVQGKAD